LYGDDDDDGGGVGGGGGGSGGGGGGGGSSSSSSSTIVVVRVVCKKMCTALPTSLTSVVNKAIGVNLYIIGSANANCIMVFSSERMWYKSSA